MPPHGGKMGPEGAPAEPEPDFSRHRPAVGQRPRGFTKQGLTGPKGQTELAATGPVRGRDQGALLSKA